MRIGFFLVRALSGLAALAAAGCSGTDVAPPTPPPGACAGLAPADAATEVRCEWTGPAAGDPWPGHFNVLSAPIVIDLNLDGNPAARSPSIAFVAYDQFQGGTETCVGDETHFGVLRVIDGASCAPQLAIASPKLIATTSLAAGDLDGDGRAEIVGVALRGHPVAFRYDEGARQLAVLWEATPVSSTCLWIGPTLHDLDGDGSPEVLLGGDVYAGATGAQLAAAPFSDVSIGRFGVVGDLPGGKRLVAGGATWGWSDPGWFLDTGGFPDGPVAIADLGTYPAGSGADVRAARDGIAEVAAVASGVLTVKVPAGRTVLGPLSLPGTGYGGPPAIADFDGDGRAEVVVAQGTTLSLVDPDCAGSAAPVCPSGSATAVAWSAAIQDAASGRSGVAAFDFENDGSAEVVFADECFVRILDGATGAVRVSMGRRSCTWHDMPVVADADGDGRAEVVVNSNANCAITCPGASPPRSGILVLGNPGWAAARPVWNQHAYVNRGVTAAGRIPSAPTPDFALTGPNGFRLQDACTP